MLSVCAPNAAPSIYKTPLVGSLKWLPERSQRDVCPNVSGSTPASSSQSIWMGFCYSLKICAFDSRPLSISTGDKSEESSPIDSWGHNQVQAKGISGYS